MLVLVAILGYCFLPGHYGNSSSSCFNRTFFLPHTWELNYFCSMCALMLCLWGVQTYSKCGLNYDRIWTLNLHYCHARNIMASKRLKICVPWKYNNNKEGNNINTYLLYLISIPNYCEF